MGSWSYRIVRRRHGEADWFELKEVFYDEDGSILSWAEGAPAVAGDSPAEIAELLQMMLKDVQQYSLLEETDLVAPA